jgi:hypothetical protein
MAAEKQSKRTWVIEEGVIQAPDGELVLGAEFDMDRARVLLDRLLGTLAEIGGMVAITVDRVKVGEGPGGVPLAVSQRLIVEWQAFSPLRDPERTGGADPTPEELEERLEVAEPDIEGALADARVAVGGDPWDTDDEPIEEPDE